MADETAIATRPDARSEVSSRVVVFVCTACGKTEGTGDEHGRKSVADVIGDGLRDAGITDVAVRNVECLAVCKRPATMAITAPDSWTYILGDLDADADPQGIVDTVLAYRRSANGIVPWAERPAVFCKGVIARVPPQSFVQPERKSA